MSYQRLPPLSDVSGAKFTGILGMQSPVPLPQETITAVMCLYRLGHTSVMLVAVPMFCFIIPLCWENCKEKGISLFELAVRPLL